MNNQSGLNTTQMFVPSVTKPLNSTASKGGSAYRPDIGPVDIGNPLLPYSLTSFAVPLFTVANGL